MKGLKIAIMKLSTLVLFWGLIYFYFSKVCKETNSLVGKNLEWTGWTINFVFAIIVILGIIFSIWIISGKGEEREEARQVKKAQKIGETEKEFKEEMV